MADKKKYKFACMIWSYKRPTELIAQIYSMLDQSYDHSCYIISVAVKGLSEYFIEQILVPKFKKYIDSGRIVLKYHSNKNGLLNVTDTTSQIDVDAYDYFVEIDDDDFYSVDYLKVANDYLNSIDPIPEYSLWFTHIPYFALKRFNGCFSIIKDKFCFGGGTAFYSRVVIKALMHKWSNIEYIRNSNAKGRLKGWRQDYFIHNNIICNYGMYDATDWVIANNIPILHTRSASLTSLSNRLSLKSDVYKDLSNLTSDTSLREEDFLYLIHTAWSADVCIYNNKGIRTDVNDVFDVLEFERGRYITVYWNKWNSTERFDRQQDGSYKLQ